MSEQPDPRDKQITDWVRTHREEPESQVDVDAAWSQFSARNELGATVTPMRPRTIPTIWRIAAVLVAVAGGATLWRVA